MPDEVAYGMLLGSDESSYMTGSELVIDGGWTGSVGALGEQDVRLEGKVALITEAATGVEGELMGFGGTAARLFAREGAKVVLCDIDEAGGEKTAAQIREGGGEALFLRLDVTNEEEWGNAVGTAVETYCRLDVLVNNAGIAPHYGT